MFSIICGPAANDSVNYEKILAHIRDISASLYRQHSCYSEWRCELNKSNGGELQAISPDHLRTIFTTNHFLSWYVN
jgi:hypothetical protein